MMKQKKQKGKNNFNYHLRHDFNYELYHTTWGIFYVHSRDKPDLETVEVVEEGRSSHKHKKKKKKKHKK